MTAPRIIGVVTSLEGYDGLHALFRARADQLAIPRNDPVEARTRTHNAIGLDGLSGLADGYVSKLLSPIPMKYIGRLSLGPLMSALAVKLIMVEDLEMLERIERKVGRQIRLHSVRVKKAGGKRLAKRNQYPQRLLRKGNGGWGRMMRARQLLTQSAAKRKRIAKIARRARKG